MLPQNIRHLTIEELSASLDQQLSPEERSYTDAHLHTCEHCQRSLDDLRQTVAFLHALPEPELLRSFALPADFSLEPGAAPADEAKPPVASLALRRAIRQNRRGGAALRWAGSIAAVVGFALLLSGAFSTFSIGRTQTVNSAASTVASSTSSRAFTDATATTMPRGVLQPHASTSEPKVSSVTQPAPAVRKPAAKQPGSTIPPLLNPALAQGQLALGVLLLVLGAAGIATSLRKQAP